MSTRTSSFHSAIKAFRARNGARECARCSSSWVSTRAAGISRTSSRAGEQQRVAIARALVNDPSLILADEPTGSLDGRNDADVLDMLEALHRAGATVLMVTHSEDRAARAERVVHLCHGRIVPATGI
jgi:ABC-type lipoprotein export system ATPase subunit